MESVIVRTLLILVYLHNAHDHSDPRLPCRDFLSVRTNGRDENLGLRPDPHTSRSDGKTPHGARSELDGLWKKALRRYEVETGKSLFELPLPSNLPTQPKDFDEVMKYFESQKELFKVFRGRGGKVRGMLKPIVDLVLFLKENPEAASVSTENLYPSLAVI